MKTFNFGELRVRERDLGQEYYKKSKLALWLVGLLAILTIIMIII